MRFLYNLLTYLVLLPYAGYWLVRGFGNRVYFDRLGQRFGFGFPKFDACIWIHAVSVGEVQAAASLVRALARRVPERKLLITTVTPTGAACVRNLFGDLVEHAYIPFEFPHAVASFFRRTNPDLALIMETEIWPNLYRGCGVRKIPLVLVSARISPKSVPGYRKLLPLIRETLSHGIIIAAQSESDAERFLALGANPARTRVTGNIKFDGELAPQIIEQGRALREELFGDRPVWIAASTHEGEEDLILDVHQALLAARPDLLLLLVPRHPERFADVRDLIRRSGLPFVARTDGRPVDEKSAVFLGDTMGEVPLFYAASDIAFVAGSLLPIGGHNLLEPAAQGVPLITGPYNFNAQDIADMFIRLGACRRVADADELVVAVRELLADPAAAREMGRKGLALLEDNRGALQRLMVLLEPLLADR